MITTQQAFRIRFKLDLHESDSDRKTIQVWVSKFKVSGSVMRRKSTG